MDVNPIDIWNSLGYIEGAIFTLWLGILYYMKCWIDHHFNQK